MIDAAAEHGLAPLSGSSSQVGVVGYTTGGGLGPLCRRYGFAADHVTRFTIVTADGAVREVLAESTDPDDVDLFWAVRGGKGSFGIVTELEFGLVPVTTVPRWRRSSSRARTPPRCCTPGASGRRRCPRTRRRRSRCCACPPTPSCPSRCAAGSSWRCGSPTSATRGPRAARPDAGGRASPSWTSSPTCRSPRSTPCTWTRPSRCPRGTAASRWPSCPPRPSTRVLAQAGPGVAVAAHDRRDPAARWRARPGAPRAQRRDRPRRRVLGLHRRA